MSKLKRIVLHWTAGSYSNLEKDDYHFIVDKDGNVHKGTKPPESNIPKDGRSLSNQPSSSYVAHCGGGNSFAIGVSLAGMAGYKGPNSVGDYPLTAKQCEAAWQLVAQLCYKYDIAPTQNNVMTHFKFGKLHPDTTSAGKIDIVYLPYQPKLRAEQIDEFILDKVKWYYDRLGEKEH